MDNLNSNFRKITEPSISIHFHIKSFIFHHAISNSSPISTVAMHNIFFRFIKLLYILHYIYALHLGIVSLILVSLLLLLLVLSTILLVYAHLRLFCSLRLHLG
jgi:hypothetical protein